MRQPTQAVQRISIARIGRQNPAINRLRLGQPAGLLMLLREFQ